MFGPKTIDWVVMVGYERESEYLPGATIPSPATPSSAAHRVTPQPARFKQPNRLACSVSRNDAYLDLVGHSTIGHGSVHWARVGVSPSRLNKLSAPVGWLTDR